MDATNSRGLVLNAGMTRQRVLQSTALLPAVAALALPAAAPAKVAELGQLADDVRGACPTNCVAVSRTTGYQAKVGPDRGLYVAPSDGRIVAWTIALGKPGPKQTAFFTSRLGGEPQATVVVLAPEKKLVRRVVAKAPLQKLTDYMGQMVQFPLEQSLPIKKGQYVALTVPSWAPALQVGLGSDTSWRPSRAKDACLDTATQTALIGDRRSQPFICLFRTARLTYSATFVSNPVVMKDVPAPRPTAPPAPPAPPPPPAP